MVWESATDWPPIFHPSSCAVVAQCTEAWTMRLGPGEDGGLWSVPWVYLWQVTGPKWSWKGFFPRLTLVEEKKTNGNQTKEPQQNDTEQETKKQTETKHKKTVWIEPICFLERRSKKKHSWDHRQTLSQHTDATRDIGVAAGRHGVAMTRAGSWRLGSLETQKNSCKLI